MLNARLIIGRLSGRGMGNGPHHCLHGYSHRAERSVRFLLGVAGRARARARSIQVTEVSTY